MKDRDVFEKYQFLKHLLRPLRKVAVAFSGGVDSSLLLFAAIETLGSENVMALHGRSCLNYSEESIEDFYQKNYPNHSNLHIVDLEPLSSITVIFILLILNR